MDATKNQMKLTPTQKQAALRELLSLLMPADSTAEQAQMSEEEKLKAAYALNLCTVSVSQIIDYNDIFFLEQEYEAILNNLNLEEMPKDEALLRILKQLLDVITYFRIQEGEKKLLEKEYQQIVDDLLPLLKERYHYVMVEKNPFDKNEYETRFCLDSRKIKTLDVELWEKDSCIVAMSNDASCDIALNNAIDALNAAKKIVAFCYCRYQ